MPRKASLSIAALVVGLTILGGFGLRALGEGGGDTPSPDPGAGWHRVVRPDLAFSMALPEGWAIAGEPGSGNGYTFVSTQREQIYGRIFPPTHGLGRRPLTHLDEYLSRSKLTQALKDVAVLSGRRQFEIGGHQALELDYLTPPTATSSSSLIIVVALVPAPGSLEILQFTGPDDGAATVRSMLSTIRFN
jgi:hypothetical protein